MTGDEIRRVFNSIAAMAPQPGEQWVHYRGITVTVKGIALREADLTPLVLYEHDEVVWARTLAEWGMEVLGTDGKPVRRFRRAE